MKTTPFATTAIGSDNAKFLENSRWRSRFGRSWCKSRTIKSIWPLRSAKRFRMLALGLKDAPQASAARDGLDAQQTRDSHDRDTTATRLAVETFYSNDRLGALVEQIHQQLKNPMIRNGGP